LRIPVSTLARRKKGKHFPFEESEQIFRIARLFDKAVNVFWQEVELPAPAACCNRNWQ
jgi:uncharacterized protein (DUF2384 family)